MSQVETLEQARVIIADLERRLADAAAVIANPSLTGMNVEGNSLMIGLEGAGPMLFAQSFAEYFRHPEAKNFVELRMTSPDPEIGQLVCTLQKLGKETPTQQRDAARRALAQSMPAVIFAGLVLKAHRNDGQPGDMDGAQLQEAAIKAGLLEERLVSERCGEQCTCAEFVGADEWLVDGVRCYFTTEAGKLAVKAAEA